MGASIFAGIESTEYNLHMETKNIVRRSHLAKIPRIAELRDQAEEGRRTDGPRAPGPPRRTSLGALRSKHHSMRRSDRIVSNARCTCGHVEAAHDEDGCSPFGGELCNCTGFEAAR
jgi:hypothetical protein